METNISYFEDCLTGMDRIPDKSIPFIFCDLPYGTTQCAWDVIIPFDKLWAQYKRILAPNGCIALFAAQPFTSLLVASNIPMFKYEWIWQKSNPKGHLNAEIQPMRAHESICIFYNKQPTYNPQKTSGHVRKVSNPKYKKPAGDNVYGAESRDTKYDSTDRYPLSVLQFPNEKHPIHPTQKPVALVQYMVQTYTNVGDIALDNCSGAGTIAIACINTGREYILFENNETHFGNSQNRINNHRGLFI